MRAVAGFQSKWGRSHTVGVCHIQNVIAVAVLLMSFVIEDCHLVVLSVLHTAPEYEGEVTASTSFAVVWTVWFIQCHWTKVTVPASPAY